MSRRELPELAVIGAGGHGFVVAEAAALHGAWSVIRLYDDDPLERRDLRSFHHGGAVDALRARLRANVPAPEVVVGIGRNEIRLRFCAEMAELGARQATVVHPSAVVSPSASVGAGTVVLAGAIVGARAIIGAGCIVNAGSIVDHDCVIADGVHVAPRAALAGGVRVGRGAWVGVGASVMPGITIGEAAQVQAGAVVVADLPARGLASGAAAGARQR